MPIDIHGLARRYESMPAFDLPSIMESVKAFRSTLQARKKEVLEPFGLDDLDKFKDDPRGFAKAVDRAVESFKEKKEQSALYRKLYEDDRCLVTFTNRPEGAAAAGSHLKVDGEVKCPWCICVKHPENERWWEEYHSAALAFIFAKDDACCIVLAALDALSIIEGSFAFSQAEGIENKGLNNKPEEQKKVIERLYRKTGLTDARLVKILAPALKPFKGELEEKGAVDGLFNAVGVGNIEQVKESLARGADVDAQGKYGLASLHLAAGEGHLEICKLLLEMGARADIPTIFGDSPLHWAAGKCHLEICKLLLDAGLDVNTRNKRGNTPLHWAASKGCHAACKLLIEAGADAGLVNKTGHTALSPAVFEGHYEVCKLLVDAGCAVDSRDEDGWSPLHDAARNNHVEVCKLLIDAGADMDARDKQGRTPLSIARSMGRRKAVEVLLKAGAGSE